MRLLMWWAGRGPEAEKVPFKEPGKAAPSLLLELQQAEPAKDFVRQEFRVLFFSFLSLFAGVMISASPSQPGEELVASRKLPARGKDC